MRSYYFLYPILYPLHRLLRKKSVWAAIAPMDKPWGGNAKALCDAAALTETLREILIVNMSTTPDDQVAAQYQGAPVAVSVLSNPLSDGKGRIDLRNAVRLLSADYVFYTDHRHYGLPNCRVNLWHGIPIKRIALRQAGPRKPFWKTFPRHDYYIASSRIDQFVMSGCFDVPPERVLNIGLPRNDWLDLQRPLPPDLERQEGRLKALLGGRRLVLYAPTFRDKDRDSSKLPLTRAQLQEWSDELNRIGAVLGVRPHPSQKHALGEIAGSTCLDCGSEEFPEMQVLLRVSSILVTDYSSSCLDFVSTGRPSICYVPDMGEYSRQRGLMYSLPAIFPGPIIHDFPSLIACACQLIRDSALSAEVQHKLAFVSALFHDQPPGTIRPGLIRLLLEARYDGPRKRKFAGSRIES